MSACTSELAPEGRASLDPAETSRRLPPQPTSRRIALRPSPSLAFKVVVSWPVEQNNGKGVYDA
jgi:hypothetical protein